MVNGKWTVFIYIHPFIHRIHRTPTAVATMRVRVSFLAQGHLVTQLGVAGDRTSNLLVTSKPTLPRESHTAPTSNWRRWVLTTANLSLEPLDVALAPELRQTAQGPSQPLSRPAPPGGILPRIPELWIIRKSSSKTSPVMKSSFSPPLREDKGDALIR